MRIKLYDLVQCICAGTYTQSQLVQFVNLAQKTALSYLKYQEVMGKRISAEKSEVAEELEDLAVDCIAGLFRRDENGHFVQLRKYFTKAFSVPQLHTDYNLLILLRRLIIKKTKQELSRIFRERDPEGAKILRNIKIAARGSENFYLFREMGRDFVCFKSIFESDTTLPSTANIANGQGAIHLASMGLASSEPNSNGLRKNRPPIPDYLLESRFLTLHALRDPVAASIAKLLSIVDEAEEYQNCLALDVIARILRNVNVELFREQCVFQTTDASPLDHLQLKEIEETMQEVIDNTWKKLETRYLQTGKLNRQFAEVYQRALHEVLQDLVQKEKRESYFCHFKRCLPGLSQKEYRQKHRSIFEYLAKVAKGEFRKKLKEML